MKKKFRIFGIPYRIVMHEIGWPLAGASIFLLAQTFLQLGEISLTMLALGAVVISFLPGYHRGEIPLFITGVLFGLIVEVVLGLFHRQQVWLDASFFGVPYWLPIIWGIGFIYITRIGVFFRRCIECA